jgi:predicted DNA-binding transcriptional regulator AlpA
LNVETTVKTDASLLPSTGYVRLKTVLAIYPVGRSTWYRGVAEGRFPKPVALSARTKGYPVEKIKKLIDAGAAR